MMFHVAELPEEKSAFRSMAERMDYLDACGRVSARTGAGELLRFKLARALFEGLRQAALDAIERHGVHGWLSEEGREEDAAYLSLSLTHNPELHDPAIEDVHQSTLGTSVNPRSEFYYGSTQRFRKLKNTYFDTYGFRVPTPAAKIGALGEFLSGCGLSLVRSRLSVLRGEHRAARSFDFGWHRDEPVFENLRVNIPLQSHRGFRLQIERARDRPERRSPTMSEHYLAPGHAYTFDTHRPHRVYTKVPSDVARVHLVLGFSPWFRYDAAADTWKPNEFYGRVHPFDIVRSGALHPALRASV